MSKNAIVNGKKENIAARKRWRMLARSLIKSSKDNNSELECEDDELSVRRFKGFNIISYEKKDEDADGTWYCVKTNNAIGNRNIRIRLLHVKLNPSILIGFNNTGNICIWPSEEVLAVYCLRNADKFKGKSICELGGGMAALAGLLLASEVDANKVLLTDGNEESSSNIQQTIETNQDLFKSRCVMARQLIWGQDEDHDESSRYDFIICADCLYFIAYQEQLAKTVFDLLNEKGEAILFAPKRGKTFDAFTKIAEKSFYITVVENYDEEIWQKHLINKTTNPVYDADIHYPLQLILQKKGHSINNFISKMKSQKEEKM